VVNLLRVRSADGVPICLEQTYLPLRTWPLISGANLQATSLYSLLEDHGERIVRSEELLSARLASAAELALLQRQGPLPVTAIARICFDASGCAMELTENVLAADRYVFRFALRRQRPDCALP
jgi:GntR family transcriptional regulator